MSEFNEYGPELDMYIVRHGHSAANKAKVLQGWADYPLSDEGVNQARTAGRFLSMSGVPLEVIYSSPLSRARRTAEEIASSFKPAAEIIMVEEFKEISIGSLTDMPIADARLEYPEFFEERRVEMVGFEQFGGESIDSFTDRIKAGLMKVLARHKEGDAIAITGHGGSNLMMLKLLLDMPGVQRFFRIHNCFIAKIVRRFRSGGYVSKLDSFLTPEQQKLMVEGLRLTRGLAEEE